jgi:hypothetical protein
MALTNAEKQKRWREKRNDRASVLDGTPKDMAADALLRRLGVREAKRVLRALDKRLKAIKPDS